MFRVKLWLIVVYRLALEGAVAGYSRLKLEAMKET